MTLDEGLGREQVRYNHHQKAANREAKRKP